MIIPIIKTGADNEKVFNKCYLIRDELKSAGIRVLVDERDNYTSGWKFNDWEVKGIPLRFEVGQKDVEADQVTAVWRVNGKKGPIPISEVAT